MKKILYLFILITSFTVTSNSVYSRDFGTISLAGTWQLELNSSLEKNAQSNVFLPGSLQSQGYGNTISKDTRWIGGLKDTSWLKYSGKQPNGDFNIAGWLQPQRHYVGIATYQKEIFIPTNWENSRIQLFMERVHVSSKVWIDDKLIGNCDSLSAPHIYDLGSLKPGKHILKISVDNNLPVNVGKNAHCVTDHTQTAWNGIIGKIELRKLPQNFIENVIAIPNSKNRSLELKTRINIGDANDFKLKYTITTPNNTNIIKESPLQNSEEVSTIINFNSILNWDEFSPNIYKIKVEIIYNEQVMQDFNTQCGFYSHQIKDQQFYINGRPTLLRGTLDCATFPLTGYPNLSKEYWQNLFAVCKKMGINHIRYHSWTPPKVAFDVADEMGFYLQCEHAWTNLSNKKLQEYVMKETKRIIEQFGNHPSFMFAAYGNEPSGRGKNGGKWLEEWVAFARKIDYNRKFYTSAAGWATSSNSDYYDIMKGMRVYPWRAGLNSSINANPPESVSNFNTKTQTDKAKTFVAHETGEWCVFPDFNEIQLYTGFLKPINFEIFKKNMQDNNIYYKWEDFFNASGKLQTLCYKYEIEKLRRTTGCGGYQLLGINDFPGQGTAPVGSVNVFWKIKPYTSAAQYSQFNEKTAILANFPKFIFSKGEKISFKVDISNYDKTSLINQTMTWKLIDKSNKEILSKKIKLDEVPIGLSTLKNRFEITTSDLTTPAKYKISFKIDGTKIYNEYDIWIYAPVSCNDGSVFATQSLEEAVRELNKGKTVLLSPTPDKFILPENRKPVLGFSTIFWNTVWSNRQPPTVMGVELNPTNPAFNSFPTDNFSNYNWWYIFKETTAPIWLDKAPKELKPLVYIIDDWFTNRRLALIIEAKFGKGKLILSSIPIYKTTPDNLVINQLRNSLIEYMNSKNFNPKTELNLKVLKTIVKE